MNIFKVISQLLIVMLFAYGANAFAEKPKYRVNEVHVTSINLANDRTGIVKDVACFGCDFKMVKITEDTKATVQGVPVDILEVKKLSDKVVMVAFDPKTREVLYLRW